MQDSRLMDKAGEGDGGGGNKGGDPPADDKGTPPAKDKDTDAALALYRALQDENTGPEIIETLARRAGLLDENKNKGGNKDNEPDDKPKKSISAAKLRAKLGKDYEKFADLVGPAFDEIIEERLADLRKEYSTASATDKWSAQVDKFTENHELTPEIEDQMKELMADAPPNVNGKNFDAQKYLTRMYKLALDELEIEAPEPKAKKTSKHKPGKDDLIDDLNDVKEIDAPKNATIDDAVNAALKGIRFKRRT